MDKRVKRKWLRALRSRAYAQGRERLLRTEKGVDRFCCLGVLCELHAHETGDAWGADENYHGSMGMPPYTVREWAGFLGDSPLYALIDMNDLDRQSFSAIADYIEENL